MTTPLQPRRVYIDWLRGVAVLCMILWHAVDSWHLRTGRDTTGFSVVGFLGGWAAPMFLFLAGLSMPMAGVSRMARGDTRKAAARALGRRGWQVFVLAHLFRFQSFVLNPNAAWNGLLKPDILNVLGLAMVAAGFAWGRADSPRTRVWWLLAPAILIVFVLAPWAPAWWWPTLLPPRLEAYVRPVGSQGVFSLFPPAGYLFAGVFVGATLTEGRAMGEAWFQRRSAMAGLLLVASGVALSVVPLPTPIARLLAPGMVVCWRIGGILLMLAGAWWMQRDRPASASNPLVVFGRTSLFVYWVHVELAYGVFSYPLKNTLTLPWAITAYVLFTTAMYGLAVLWIRRSKEPLVPARLRARPDVQDLAVRAVVNR